MKSILAYSKSRNLIGFPLNLYQNGSSGAKNEFALYEIDLEKGFTLHGEIVQKDDYRTNIRRAIYIEDSLYTIARDRFVKYDLATMDEQKKLEI